MTVFERLQQLDERFDPMRTICLATNTLISLAVEDVCAYHATPCPFGESPESRKAYGAAVVGMVFNGYKLMRLDLETEFESIELPDLDVYPAAVARYALSYDFAIDTILLGGALYPELPDEYRIVADAMRSYTLDVNEHQILDGITMNQALRRGALVGQHIAIIEQVIATTEHPRVKAQLLLGPDYFHESIMLSGTPHRIDPRDPGPDVWNYLFDVRNRIGDPGRRRQGA